LSKGREEERGETDHPKAFNCAVTKWETGKWKKVANSKLGEREERVSEHGDLALRGGKRRELRSQVL